MEGLYTLKNFENILNSIILGGRFDNPIIYIRNKNSFLKTIFKQEKDFLVKMLKDYQIRTRDKKL